MSRRSRIYPGRSPIQPPAAPKSITTLAQQNGWDLKTPPPQIPGGISYNMMVEMARMFESLADDNIGANSTDGFRRRTETVDHRPKGNNPYIDPPVTNSTIWNASAIQAAISEHTVGTFTNSGYLVEAMLSDARVSHAVNSRTKGVMKRKPFFSPNKRAKDQKLARYIADQYQEMYYDILPIETMEQLWMWTPMMGWSLFNMVWDAGQEDMFLPTLRHWHPSYTFFLNTGELDERLLQAITMGGGDQQSGTVPIEIGDPEWFHFAPYGAYRGWIRGAVRQVGIPWLVRNFSLRDWSRCSEVHGLPQRIVKVPANALEEDKARIYQKLIRLASEATFILPTAEDGTGFSVELLEPKNTKSWEVFQSLGMRCDSDIMLAIKGTQLMSGLGDAGGGSSSMAASKMVREEDGDYSDSDAIKVCSAMRSQIFGKITEYNYSDQGDDLNPLIELSDEPPQDKSLNAKAWLDLSNAMLNWDSMGVEVDVKQVGETYDVPFKLKATTTNDNGDIIDVDGEEIPETEVKARLQAILMARSEDVELRKTMTLQTIIISKDEFTLKQAKSWLTDHEYKTDVDETDSSYRFRQRDPGDFVDKSFRTIDVETGIKFILGKLKKNESHSIHRRRARHDQHQRFVDEVTEHSIRHGVKAMSPHLQRVQQAVKDAKTPEELQLALKKLARAVKQGSLQGLVKNSRLMAHMAGRSAQVDELEK